MIRQAFTLLEIIVVMVILAVLATLAFPVYESYVEEARAVICETNLRGLEAALDIYAIEHDVMPADLSQIPAGYIQRGYASILKEKGAWKIKLAYFILELEERGLAYAVQAYSSPGNNAFGISQPPPKFFLKDILANGNIRLITCPLDSSPPASGGRSYAINRIILTDVDGDGVPGTSRDYKALPEDTLLIGDCEYVTITSSSDLAPRHKLGNERRALGVYKDKDVWEHESGLKKKNRGRKKQRSLTN